MAATANQEWVTEMQRRIPPRPVTPKTRADFRRVARWWELEAMRGYESSDRSRLYAANMRWLVELLDNGVNVVGRRFDDIMRGHARSPPSST